MTFNIDEQTVVQYLRDTLAPVPFDDLVTEFSGAQPDEAIRKQTKAQLQRVLIKSINFGLIMHCNNHFYSATHAEDLQEMLENESDSDGSSDHSIISFSSCESFTNKPLTVEDMDEVETDEKSSTSSVELENQVKGKFFGHTKHFKYLKITKKHP